MPLNPAEQELYDWAKSSLPSWFNDVPNGNELLEAFAKIFARTRNQTDEWVDQTYLGNAEGIWLNEHARDRGTFRQGTESDASLHDRLRFARALMTPHSLTLLVNERLLSDGIPSLIVVPEGGWSCTWSVTGHCTGTTTIPEGKYTLVELLTLMQIQFYAPATSTGNVRIRASFSAATGIAGATRFFATHLGTPSGAQMIISWGTSTGLRDALGFTADINDADGDILSPNTPAGRSPCGFLELRKFRAHFRVGEPQANTGGEITVAGDVITLTSIDANTLPAGYLPTHTPAAFPWLEPSIARTLSLATGPNAGLIPLIPTISTWSGYFPGGTPEVSTGAWSTSATGPSVGGLPRKTAYFGRGYRMSRAYTASFRYLNDSNGQQSFIVILPYGTTATAESSIREILRAHKAGGIGCTVERRINP